MSSRTDQGLPAKVTDRALLEEGARILSASSQPIDGVVGVMPAPTHVCSEGHRTFVADADVLSRCPRSKCAGKLRRIGRGSRKGSKKSA